MGLRRWLWPFALTAAFAFSAHAQQGQTLRDRDPDVEAAQEVAAAVQQANYRWGSFYLWSQIRLTDAGFSTDINVPTGEGTGGLTLGVEAPQRLYYVPHRKVIFSADVIPGYTFLGNNFRSGQFDYHLRGDAHFLTNHLYLDVYAIGSDRIRAHVSEINRLATTKVGEIGVAGEWKYSSRTSGTFALRSRDVTYPEERFQPDDAPVELLDRKEQVARVSLHHKTFPLTSLFIAAEAGDYAFDRTTFKDSDRSSVGGGLRYDGDRNDFRVEAGATKLEFNNAAQPDYSGLTWSVAADRGVGRWSMAASVAHDVAFAIFRDNNYYESTIAAAGISRLIGRDLRVRANATVEKDEFPIPVEGIRRRDDISFYSVGFTYSRWRLGFGSDVGWYERTSTFGGDEDEGIRWLLHLSFTL